MEDKKKKTPTKKKVSKETQAMEVRKAGDKGYTKGFVAGKLESANTIKDLRVRLVFRSDDRLEARKALDDAAKDASRDLRFWQFMTGISIATLITMVVL